MNEETQRRNHALHNEKVCQYLAQSGEFPDWVITTAFYTALHFVKYKIFPLLLDNGKRYSSLDDYRRKIGYQQHGSSAHSILRKLLNQRFKNIAAPYNELYDSCQNARYTDYDISSEEVTFALDNLAEIKKYCNTNKPSYPTPKKEKP